MEPGETTKTRDRAPGLDGVRALAVLTVIGFHEGASGLPGGFLGVDIFFVLSGFLITDLLVARYDRTGRLDLTGFWTRRARRLLPALAVMLVVVTAAATVIEPGQEASLRLALLAAATYTSNWYQILHHVSYFAAAGQAGAPPPLDHLWSLAIEEQFYLVWPLIVWCVIARLATRRARVACALTGAAVSALVMTIQYTPGGDPSAVYYGTDTHASALLIGAALALARPLRALTAIPAAHSRRLDMGGIAGLVVLAWAAGHFSGSDPVVYPVGLLLAALGAAGLVAAAAGHGVIAAITSWRPLRWVGVRSYGIYLWHWPVIAFGTALAGPGASSAWLWPVEIVVTIGLASASWRYVEAPIMRNGLGVTLRHWIQLVAAASRRPAAGTRGRAIPVAVAAAAAITVVVACYGIARPPVPDAPSGLLRQVANGERVSSAPGDSFGSLGPLAPSASSAAAGRGPPTPPPRRATAAAAGLRRPGDGGRRLRHARLRRGARGGAARRLHRRQDRPADAGRAGVIRSLAAAAPPRRGVQPRYERHRHRPPAPSAAAGRRAGPRARPGQHVRPAGLGARGQHGARRGGPARQAHRTGRLAPSHRHRRRQPTSPAQTVNPARPTTPASPAVTPSASVKKLQQELGQLNYYEGPVDGLMGPQTVAAIQDLQRHGLPQTGTMNAATQKALDNYLAHGNNQMGGNS